MQVCTSLQTDNHASTPPLSFFTGRMPFLPPNQQRQSTEGTPWVTGTRKSGKDHIYHISADMQADRQTHRQTQSSQTQRDRATPANTVADVFQSANITMQSRTADSAPGVATCGIDLKKRFLRFFILVPFFTF